MPNHLARVSILMHHGRPGYPLSGYFSVDYAPVPNLGLDALLMLFMPVLSPVVTMKAASSVAICLWIYGCHRLSRVLLGGPVWMVVPASLLTYNGMFQYGFINFSFSIGIYLLVFSAWLRMRGKWTAGRLVWMSLLAVLTYLCHLGAVMLLLASMGWVALLDWWKIRRTGGFALDMLPAVPVLAAYATLRWLVAFGEDQGLIEWEQPRAVVLKLFSPLIGYTISWTIAAVVLAATGLTSALWAARARWQWPQASLGFIFLTLFLVIPGYIHDSGDVNTRFLLPAYVVLMLCLRLPGLADPFPKLAIAGLGLLIAGQLVHVGDVTRHWITMSDEIEKQVTLLKRVDPGSRIYPIAWMPPGTEESKRYRHWIHMVHYATVFRDTYIPTVFSVPGSHMLRKKPGSLYYRSIDPATPVTKPPWDTILGEYDYVFGCGLSAEYRSLLGSRAHLAGEAGACALYQTGRLAAAR